MIAVTCRNGERFAVDPDLIERIESRPDTAVFMVDGAHYVVEESVGEVLQAVQEHRARRLVTATRMERRAPAPCRPGAPAASSRDAGLATRGHCRFVVPGRRGR